MSLFMYLFIHVFIYSCIYLFIYLFMYLCIYLFVYLCICLFMYLFVYLFMYLFMHLCIYFLFFSFSESLVRGENLPPFEHDWCKPAMSSDVHTIEFEIIECSGDSIMLGIRNNNNNCWMYYNEGHIYSLNKQPSLINHPTFNHCGSYGTGDKITIRIRSTMSSAVRVSNYIINDN